MNESQFRNKLNKNIKISIFCLIFSGILFTQNDIQTLSNKLFSSYDIGSIVFAKGSIVSFSNVSSLKSGNVSIGQTVKTSYYSSKGDLGGATYTIDASPKYSHENISIPLNNGLYANLIISNRSVNVASLGIFPGEDMMPAFYKLELSLKDYVDEFKFNNGNYTFTTPLKLGGFSYIGSSKTSFVVSPSFSKKTYRLVYADPREWENAQLNLSIQKINFLYEPHTNSILNGSEVLLLAVAGCNNCTINNCSFTARPASQNGCFEKVDLLWFRDLGTNNIHISNSKFLNQTATGHSTSHLVGGCLWYMGNENETSNSIIVDNCSFYNTTSDEAVGFWKGAFKHVEFNDCEFINDIHQSDGIVNLSTALFEEVSFNKCTFQSNVSAKKQLCFFGNRSNELTKKSVTNCIFVNNNGNASTRVPGDGDINTFIYIPANDSAWSINVSGCTFNSLQNEYEIKSIVNSYHSPNVTCNFDSSNKINVTTTTNTISHEYLMGDFY